MKCYCTISVNFNRKSTNLYEDNNRRCRLYEFCDIVFQYNFWSLLCLNKNHGFCLFSGNTVTSSKTASALRNVAKRTCFCYEALSENLVAFKGQTQNNSISNYF
jgi:hypothetical protein